MADVRVGKITHYFGNIGVAVIGIEDEALTVGDTIKITGSNEFEQAVESMQVNHENIDVAEKGTEVGMKMTEKVKKGDEIYKVI